ncbi:MAG: histidine triad nucleotide-binding protein [Bacillota bacterium]|nr:histidine triad nucleotide-binding protein [Bacillota bacterium]
MSDCIFCKIANGEIPSQMAYEDDRIAVFHDLEPQAPVHVLMVPKKHIASLDAAEAEDSALLGHILTTVKKVAAELGLENGYRLVCNCGQDGLQTVQHLHFHLLGKRQMSWPPG